MSPLSPATADDTPRGWLRGALVHALPAVLPTICGALLWAGAMAASAVTVLVFDQWETPDRIRAVAVVFALGGLMAFPLALIVARFLSYRRGGETAFAAAFLSLVVLTVAAVGGLYALQQSSHYLNWRADMLTGGWFFQFGLTMASAFYSFCALGLRLFFPLGFTALLIASLWFARAAR